MCPTQEVVNPTDPPTACDTHQRVTDCMQLFITLDLGTYSLVQGSAVAVFAPQPGEGGITAIDGNQTGAAPFVFATGHLVHALWCRHAFRRAYC